MDDDRSFVSELFLGLVYLTDEFDEAFAAARHALFGPVGKLKLAHGATLAVLRKQHSTTLTFKRWLQLRFDCNLTAL